MSELINLNNHVSGGAGSNAEIPTEVTVYAHEHYANIPSKLLFLFINGGTTFWKDNSKKIIKYDSEIKIIK